MISRLRQRKHLSTGMLMVLAIGFWLSAGHRGEAATMPAFVRVGIESGDSFIDLKPAQGSYRLLDKASGKVLVDSIKSGETYRVQIKSGGSELKLLRSGSTSSNNWEDKGTYKGPLMLEEVTTKPSRGSSASTANLVEMEGRKYRGSMEIRANQKGTSLVGINQLGLEDYLCGVLPREVGEGWPMEALKAQAVAARTYALRSLNRYADYGYDLSAGTSSQVYGGYSCEGSNCTKAVMETKGMVLVDNQGSLAATLYHSNSGGYLEDNVNVNGTDIYYLKAKPDPYSLGLGLADWGLETVVEGRDAAGRMGLKDSLLSSGSSIGRIESLKLVKYPSGRVDKVLITDERGNTMEKTGSQFGVLFNPGFQKTAADQFMSRMFDLTTDATFSVIGGQGEVITQNGGGRRLAVVGGNGVTKNLGSAQSAFQVQGADAKSSVNIFPQKISIRGHGWGHGVGMSQWGAYGMAKQGFQYDKILEFYYSGTRLVTLK